MVNVFLFTFGLIIIAFFSVGELFITHILYISKGVTTIEDKSENLFDQLKKIETMIERIWKECMRHLVRARVSGCIRVSGSLMCMKGSSGCMKARRMRSL